jgi:tRNA A-37 threonylcarbamoyl transferase component Bud32
MHLICPHCQNPIELIEETPSEEVVCPSCGSSFHVASGNLQQGTITHDWGSRHLGRFELLQVLGIGAFGTVWKARDPQLDRTIALKIPRTGGLGTQAERDRFIREARAAAQLRHESIVAVHEVGEHEGQPYIVSDFVEGINIAEWLSAKKPTFREAATWVAEVADALQYAHDHGVIHRDIKPSNLMLDDGGRLHVMDFGLAKRDAGEITMTYDGQVLGTPAYMAPEQIEKAHQVDGRADVYALGVVLYRLLTGELPFRGTTRMLLHQVLHDEPRPPRRINDHIPRDLETICLKAMAKEPGRRYATAQELSADLRRYLNGEAIHARPVARAERLWRWCRRSPAVASLAIMFVVALVTGTVVSTSFAIRATERAAEASRQRDQALSTLDEMRALAAEWAYEVGWGAVTSERWTVGRLYKISKFLVESQCDLSAKQEDQIAAFQGHLERMTEMEAHETAEFVAQRSSASDVVETHYYRREAAYLLARAMAGQAEVRVGDLAEARLQVARQAYQSQLPFYEEGRITLDRFCRASKFLLESQCDVSAKEDDQIAAFKAHLDRMRTIETREEAELEMGRRTIGDVAEAHYYRREAEYLLERAMAGRAEVRVGNLAEARLQAARQAYQSQLPSYEEGRITLDRFLRMSKFLLECQLEMSPRQEEKIAAIEVHLSLMKEVETREKAELAVGRGTTGDVAEAHYYRREAAYLLARAMAGRTEAHPSSGEKVRVNSVRADPTINPEVRAAALAVAQSWPDSALALNNAAWALVKRPNRPEVDSRRGLRLAEVACQLEPGNGAYLTTLGVAQYRTGQYEKAQVTLKRSNGLHGNREPADLAFLAMTQHRLHQAEAARATFERLRELMKDPKIAANAENQGFLREAEAVILNSPELPEEVFAP